MKIKLIEYRLIERHLRHLLNVIGQEEENLLFIRSPFIIHDPSNAIFKVLFPISDTLSYRLIIGCFSFYDVDGKLYKCNLRPFLAVRTPDGEIISLQRVGSWLCPHVPFMGFPSIEFPNVTVFARLKNDTVVVSVAKGETVMLINQSIKEFNLISNSIKRNLSLQVCEELNKCIIKHKITDTFVIHKHHSTLVGKMFIENLPHENLGGDTFAFDEADKSVPMREISPTILYQAKHIPLNQEEDLSWVTIATLILLFLLIIGVLVLAFCGIVRLILYINSKKAIKRSPIYRSPSNECVYQELTTESPITHDGGSKNPV
jgi:hypothetical protein